MADSPESDATGRPGVPIFIRVPLRRGISRVAYRMTVNETLTPPGGLLKGSAEVRPRSPWNGSQRQLIQRFAIAPRRDRRDRQRKHDDRPYLRHDIGETVALQQHAAHDAQY